MQIEVSLVGDAIPDDTSSYQRWKFALHGVIYKVLGGNIQNLRRRLYPLKRFSVSVMPTNS
jgi:hypothetical protein